MAVDGVDVKFLGVVQSINEARRYGMVVCEEAHQMFGQDVYAYKDVLDAVGVNVGDAIRFGIHTNAKGQPQVSLPAWKVDEEGRPIGVSEGTTFVNCEDMAAEDPTFLQRLKEDITSYSDRSNRKRPWPGGHDGGDGFGDRGTDHHPGDHERFGDRFGGHRGGDRAGDRGGDRDRHRDWDDDRGFRGDRGVRHPEAGDSRRDRYERYEPRDRSDRGDRGDRSDRGDRADRVDRGTWGERDGFSGRGGRFEHEGRRDRDDRLEASHPPGTSLFVTGVPRGATRRELLHIFRQYAGFADLRLVEREDRLLVFVTYKLPEQAQFVAEALSGYVFDEEAPPHERTRLSLQFARPKQR